MLLLQICLFINVILSQEVELGKSLEYGIISNPFTSISGMGLINNFVYCIGQVKVGSGQVWATRVDIHTPWSESFSTNSSIKQISVKHAKLGIEQVFTDIIIEFNATLD
jgi:hypothetical protein